MHTLAELYFAAVLSGANGSVEGLGSVNLLRWGLCAGGSKGGVHWVEWSVWCARAFRGKVMPHQRAKRLSLFVVRLSGYLVGEFFFMGFPYSYRTGTFGLNRYIINYEMHKFMVAARPTSQARKKTNASKKKPSRIRVLMARTRIMIK